MTTPAGRGFQFSAASATTGLILSDNATKRRFQALRYRRAKAARSNGWQGAPVCGATWLAILRLAAVGLATALAILLTLPALCPAASAAATRPTLEPWSSPLPAPFSLDSLHGSRLSLNAFKGKVVLLHFFATWCEPCVAEMASLQQLANQTRARPLTIVAINVAEVDLRVRAFFDRHPVDFPVLLDRDRTVARAWSISGLPSTVVLDAGLKPRLVVEGDLDWSRPDIVATIEALYPPETRQKD